MLFPFRRALLPNVAKSSVLGNGNAIFPVCHASKSTFAWSEHPPVPLYHHEIKVANRDQVPNIFHDIYVWTVYVESLLACLFIS